MGHLTELARVRTSGARTATPFQIDGVTFVAVPQLALDIPGQPPSMNGGDSDTELLVFRLDQDRFTEHQRLGVPGGEDAEPFRIGERTFLATASIRTGSGPYAYGTESRIFEWRSGRFVPFQSVPSFAAKQWRFFTIGDRAFLALAQGVNLPGLAGESKPSTIFEWRDGTFEEFQRVPSEWGYNWHRFTVAGTEFLAHADHTAPSTLFRWDGDRFVEHQQLAESGGRAFTDFTVDGVAYLVVARIDAPSVVLRWAGERFGPHQELAGSGGRELAVVQDERGLSLVRVNFITGTPHDPTTALNSQIYQWRGGRLELIEEFPTSGGTDVSVVPGDSTRLLVSNSLSPDVRFAGDTVLYEFRSDAASHECAEMVDLFTTYTAAPGSIGANLADAEVRAWHDDPLIVATSADVALYPGSGRPPLVEGFRLSTRGFKELAGLSHLGPAVASLVNLRTAGREWRAQARRLADATERARAANSVSLWRDVIAVEAYRGREQRITEMVAYSCDATLRYLGRAEDDDDYLTPDSLQRDYLGSIPGATDGPALINEMMVATFFLVGMDISYRLVRWFREHAIDWNRAMVIVAGRQGRPTAGVTWNTSSVATMIRGASEYCLPLERMYLAPHAPTFATPRGGDLSEVVELEQPLRRLWAQIHATQNLAETMFPAHPRYRAGDLVVSDVSDPSVAEVAELPAIRDAGDFRAMVTRLRVVLEDPRQLLSGCVTDYAVAQLVENDNDPSRVTVPGLDNVSYGG